MSSVTEISVRDARARLDADAAAVYLDVRPVAEFADGRALVRCVNVPWAFRHPDGEAWHLNADFVAIARHALGEAQTVLVGGDASERAATAAMALAAAGTLDVLLVSGGIDAWRAALLPTTRDNREGVSYVSLLTRYRRRDKPAKASAGH